MDIVYKESLLSSNSELIQINYRQKSSEYVSEEKLVGVAGRLFQHCTIRLQKKNVYGHQYVSGDLLYSVRLAVR